MNILKNLLPVGLLFIALLSLPFAGRAQFVINTNEDGTLSITGYTGTGGNVVIPDNINGRRVTMIGDSAFDSNTNLTKVTLGTNIISLGDFAFAYIYSLTDISLDTNLTDIGEYAFSGSSLTSLTLPNSVTNIGENAFSGSFNLTTVTIPSQVTTLGDGAFACPNLVAITVASKNPNYTNVGGVLFSKDLHILLQCPGSLTHYSIPGSVTAIAGSAFAECALTYDHTELGH